MGNKEYWDKKFSNRSNKLLAPEISLVENINYFKKGSVLDIACGDGRNTMFLLEKGFQVTGVDFSNQALTRLKMFAKNYVRSVNTLQVDFNLPNSLEDIGVFDNIVINHYRLNRQQLSEIKNHITANGILFICGFGEKHKAENGIREEDLIQQTDSKDIKESFDLIKYIENQNDTGYFVTYLYRKNSN
jgi:2-polyprenyl-3-methyl-5-hydroxy-6-metoxy-1,4-benzoquinol methylase